MDFLYNTIPGRFILKIFINSKVLNFIVRIFYTPCSRLMIKPYIRRHKISMTSFQGQKYKSFADFFSRKKTVNCDLSDPNKLISPCDGMLSIVPIENGTAFRVKNSWYSIHDLIPDDEVAESFRDGLCMIFRLRPEDYHHFCYIDDCYHGKGHFIEGQLHSVQPIALEKEPVFRLNRRMWSILNTEHFGRVAQIEVGAVMVGGFVHESEESYVYRGDEMGYFELCGSTIILLLQSDVKKRLRLRKDIRLNTENMKESHVRIGRAVGIIS